LNQSQAIIDTLKRVLRSEKMTYARLAGHLGVSEPTIKRIFSKGHVTLDRLEQICGVVGIPISQLTRLAEDRPGTLSQLSPEQEYELLGDPKLLLVAYMVLNHWSVAQIVEHFAISEPETIKRLAKLDRLGMIELLPGNRVKRLVARNFTWRKNGPVQNYFEQQIKLDFMSNRFVADGAHLRFLGGLLSPDSLIRMQAAIDRLAAEIDEHIQADADLPLDKKVGVGAVFAIRPWEHPAFSALKRKPSAKGNPG
jgi:transcriptional regulator with XRE-family HTH domain